MITLNVIAGLSLLGFVIANCTDHNLSTDREAQTALGGRGKGGGGGCWKQLGIQCSWICVIACLVGVLIDRIVCSLCFAVDVPVRCTVA